MLIRHFPAFVTSYFVSLEPLQIVSSDQIALGDVEPSIVSRAYISMKLWLLAGHSSSRIALGRDMDIQVDSNIHGRRMVWNELWPPFETVVLNLHHSNSAANSVVSKTNV